MNEDKRNLQGSERRDVFKRLHKHMSSAFWASDLDFGLVSKTPPGVVAFQDVKAPWELVTFAEVILYNQLSVIAPVYIVEVANPQTGPFRISLFSTGDHRPNPPRVELTLMTECRNWKELEAWEAQLRRNYQLRGGRRT